MTTYELTSIPCGRCGSCRQVRRSDLRLRLWLTECECGLFVKSGEMDEGQAVLVDACDREMNRRLNQRV